MLIEKLLALFTLLSAVIGLYWTGIKMLNEFIDKTNDSRDPRIWKIHNRVTGWVAVGVTLSFSVIAWSNFLNETNYLLQVFNLVCAMLALQSVVLFAVLRHMVWKREAYFGRPIKMRLLEEMV